MIVIHAQSREQRSTSLGAASIIELMSFMHLTGPLTFFFFQGRDRDVHVSNNDVERERSYARCLEKRHSLPLRVLLLVRGTGVSNFAWGNGHIKLISSSSMIAVFLVFSTS